MIDKKLSELSNSELDLMQLVEQERARRNSAMGYDEMRERDKHAANVSSVYSNLEFVYQPNPPRPVSAAPCFSTAEITHKAQLLKPQGLESYVPLQKPAGLDSWAAIEHKLVTIAEHNREFESKQPSAVSKALTKLESDRNKTFYWDPELSDHPEY